MAEIEKRTLGRGTDDKIEAAGVRSAAPGGRTVLAAVAAGTLLLKPLILHRLPLADIGRGMEVMLDRKGFFAKVLMDL